MISGDPKKGGVKLTSQGVCGEWSSRRYGKNRRCGDGDSATNPTHAGRYSKDGGLHCGPLCIIPVKEKKGAVLPDDSCPDACKSPGVLPGDPAKGGANLTYGVCLEWASKEQGKKKNRYCGDGDAATNPKDAKAYSQGGVHCMVEQNFSPKT